MLSRPPSRRSSDGAAGGNPLVTIASLQIIGLPEVEANLMQAHGRGGGIKRLMSNDPSLVPAGGVATQNTGLQANLMCELTTPAIWEWPLRSKGFRALERHMIAQDVITGPRQLGPHREHLIHFLPDQWRSLAS